ncbi:MAG TPA: sulfite exporter TauE/SafE family protein [Gemmatimonadaceae bacterium]|nr:sulfite exporter TauE/SafE family protein [Gemmatimonadaceae bacterium]
MLFIAIGLGAGVIAGIFGIGGGIVIGPALILMAKFQPQTATGTSLGALLLPVGALGAWEYWRRGHLNLAASLWIALGLFVGAWFGARLAQTISGPQLQKGFAIFLVLIAIRVWIKA